MSRWTALAIGYIAASAIVAAFAIFPPDGNAAAFYLMVLLGLPVSLPAHVIMFVGLMLTHGPGNLGDGGRAFVFLFWMSFVVVGQVVAARALLDAWRTSRLNRTTP